MRPINGQKKVLMIGQGPSFLPIFPAVSLSAPAVAGGIVSANGDARRAPVALRGAGRRSWPQQHSEDAHYKRRRKTSKQKKSRNITRREGKRLENHTANTIPTYKKETKPKTQTREHTVFFGVFFYLFIWGDLVDLPAELFFSVILFLINYVFFPLIICFAKIGFLCSIMGS